MAELDPALLAEMQKSRFLFFGAVEILLPGGAIRLLDGAGETVIEGERYFGSSPEWGVLSYVKGLSDSDGDSASAPLLGLVPSSDLALANLLDPALQGAPIRVMLGAMDRVTGLPIGAMYERFVGELDVPRVRWDRNSREVEFTLAGVGERLWSTEEGRRLSDAFHQSVWLGELGLGLVTDVESDVPWGAAPQGSPVAIRSDVFGSSSGGESGGGGFWQVWRSR